MAKASYQDPAIENELSISLEEVLTGCIKKLNYVKIITDKDGIEKSEIQTLKIEIKKGINAGEVIKFAQMGDQRPRIIPADIVYTLKDKPHSLFTRNGADIEYIAKITGHQYSKCQFISIPTLDNQNINFNLKSITSLDEAKRFIGRGLPYFHEPNNRGDLVVRFKLVEGCIITNLNNFLILTIFNFYWT